MGRGLAFRHARTLLTTPPHSETVGLHGLLTRSAAVEGCMAECPHTRQSHTMHQTVQVKCSMDLTVNCRDAMTCYPLPCHHDCSIVGCLIAATYITVAVSLQQNISWLSYCSQSTNAKDAQCLPSAKRVSMCRHSSDWSGTRRLWRQPVASLAPNSSTWHPPYS
jgi:hypothetical protein